MSMTPNGDVQQISVVAICESGAVFIHTISAISFLLGADRNLAAVRVEVALLKDTVQRD